MNLVSISKLDQLFRRKDTPDAKLVNAVHDSTMVEVPNDQVEECKEIMRSVMVNEPMKWLGEYFKDVPVVVDFKQGNSWDELIE
jgi:DNA polymerase I-like protein with 3'-5' exonuclease and polymerase domains